MRIRNIKPDFFKDEDLGACSAFARLLFAGLWTLADCEGKLEDRPTRIRVELFPYDLDLDIESTLSELSDRDLIVRYGVEGEDKRRFIFIPGFQKHQYISASERKGGSQLPNVPSTYKSMRQVSDKSHTCTILEPDKFDTSMVPVSDQYVSCARDLTTDNGQLTTDNGQRTTDNEEHTDVCPSCSEPLPASAPTSPATGLSFPCVGDPKTFTLTEAKLDEYRQAYSEVIDVDLETTKARQWLMDNPGRRKTARGMSRFIGGWLSRAVDRNRGPRPATTPTQADPEDDDLCFEHRDIPPEEMLAAFPDSEYWQNEVAKLRSEHDGNAHA